MIDYQTKVFESLTDDEIQILKIMQTEQHKKAIMKQTTLNRFKFDITYNKLLSLLLIQEQQDKEDKRYHIVSLTEYGKLLLEKKEGN